MLVLTKTDLTMKKQSYRQGMIYASSISTIKIIFIIFKNFFDGLQV